MDYNKGIVSIKRRIDTSNDKDIEKYLKENCLYRNEVYNDFVDAANNYEDNGGDLLNFSPRKFSVFYYNEIDKNREDYLNYASGIRAKVSSDIHDNIRIVVRDRKKYRDNTIRLKNIEYNPFWMSFGFENKRENRRLTYSAKSRVFSPYEVYITFNKNKVLYPILLKEPLLSDKTPILDKNGDMWYTDKSGKYTFREKDIKEVIFVYDIKHFYIILITEVRYNKTNNTKNTGKLSLAGIDLGIRHPVMEYNGEDFNTYKMSDKELNRIEYLESRSRRLRCILNEKYKRNKERFRNGEIESVYSKNYLKVREKLAITNRKIHNIRRNWILQTTSRIAKENHVVCVDSFEQPQNGYSYTQKMKNMNYYNRNHAMYEFNESLKHMCDKYYCLYIKSPSDSTRICSKCGFVNKKLTLSERFLKCKKCGYVIDRDKNASINCYEHIEI